MVLFFYHSFFVRTFHSLIIPHFSCHHLRHTFCTRYCENEANVKVIQAIMGHKNIKTILEIYADATIEKKQESIENFSRILDEKIMVQISNNRSW